MSRNADAAREKAAARIESARRISEAVERYHGAADRIDQAQQSIATASLERIAALRGMRDAGLSIAEMSELTGLSASRIQALLRPEGGEELMIVSTAATVTAAGV